MKYYLYLNRKSASKSCLSPSKKNKKLFNCTHLYKLQKISCCNYLLRTFLIYKSLLF